MLIAECHNRHTERSEENLRGSILSSHQLGFSYQTQVVSLVQIPFQKICDHISGIEHFCPLSISNDAGKNTMRMDQAFKCVFLLIIQAPLLFIWPKVYSPILNFLKTKEKMNLT